MDFDQNPTHCPEQTCCSQEVPKPCTGKCSQLEQELAVCREQTSDWKDKFMRLSADFENYKRRGEKERGQWMASAQAELLRQLLPSVDTLDRALSDSGKAEQTPQMQTWLAGFKMIGDALHKFLRSHEVTEITQIAEFDPALHEAIMSVEAEGKNPGDIVAVLEKGYLFKDQVLRPAKVSVSK